MWYIIYITEFQEKIQMGQSQHASIFLKIADVIYV